MPERRILIPILTLILSAAGAAYGQTIIEGEVGTDLGMYSFSNQLSAQARSYRTDRSLSKQYLGLRYSGPVATEDFSHLTLRLRLAGTYYRARNYDDGVLSMQSEYINPELDNIFSSFTLFPLRTYPLRYTFGRLAATTNRYEPARRADFQSDSPGLAVLRRYESASVSHALLWQASAAQDVGFSAEVKHEENKIARQYDFDENLDIWINITSSTPDPAPTHHVDILNSLNDVVLLYIDLNLVDTLSAGELLSLDLQKGRHEVDVVPSYFNPFNTTVNVQSTMTWRILYTPPKGSSDLDQSSNSAEGKLQIGNMGRFRDEARFLYSDLEEGVQGTSSSLGSFNNHAKIVVRRDLEMVLLTNYGANSTQVADVSSQDTQALLHQTEARWQVNPKISTALSHSYNRMKSITNGDPLKSQTHIVNGMGTIRTGWFGHMMDVRSTMTRLADSKNYANNQLMASMVNRWFRKYGRLSLRPQQGLKYTQSTLWNSGLRSSSSEMESRLTVDGERTRLPLLGGDLRVKAEWEWRSRDAKLETEIKNRVFTELGLIMNFSKRLRLTGSFSRETETYDVNAKSDGSGNETRKVVRPNQQRYMFRVAVQAQPTKTLNLGANGMMITQNSSRISRLTLTMTGKLPFFDLPVRSFLVAESKGLEGRGDQSLLQMEAQVSHRFRQISILLSYSFFSEKLFIEDYTYSEFYIKLSRAFNIR
jgi:hypothetical protein